MTDKSEADRLLEQAPNISVVPVQEEEKETTVRFLPTRPKGKPDKK